MAIKRFVRTSMAALVVLGFEAACSDPSPTIACKTGTCCDTLNGIVRPNTFECRASAGFCDVAERCTGFHADCPADLLRPNLFECRAAAGVCDPAEKCTGSSASCPADVKYIDCAGTCCESAEICRFNDTCGVPETKIVASDGAGGDWFGISVSISSDGSYAIVGAGHGDGVESDTGAVYFFQRSGTTWSEKTKLTASDGAQGDNFGSSVSISGDGSTAIVGASWIVVSTGSAYIFQRSGTTWSQVKLTAADGAENSHYGSSVSISGDGEYAIVGADAGDGEVVDSGSAYIFRRSGTTWSEQAKLTASDGAQDDGFGSSVSINGDGSTVIVGAEYDDSWAGSAYIFQRSGTTWSQQAKLRRYDGAGRNTFGESVSISGDGSTAIVGASDSAESAGSAYIFQRSGNTWSEQAILFASDLEMTDCFGSSVSISGDGSYAIVGAMLDDNWMGSVHIFQRSGTTWSEKTKLTASSRAAGDEFGLSVSISRDGSYTIVGAPYGASTVVDPGSTYIY